MTRDDTIDAYCSAWNEPNPARREGILKTVWAEAATYTDPTVHIFGRAELVAHIDNVRARFPDSRLVRTSAFDTHHDVGRFYWKKVLADGSSLPEGVDIAAFANDSRLKSIVGFCDARRKAMAS